MRNVRAAIDLHQQGDVRIVKATSCDRMFRNVEEVHQENRSCSRIDLRQEQLLLRGLDWQRVRKGWVMNRPRGVQMADPIAAWHAEHRYFGRLLALLHKEVDVFHLGGQPNYELMLDIVSYLREYTDQVHHPREDIAYAHLARHRPDLGLVLERLKQEHRVIARAGDTLRSLLQAIVGGAVLPRAELETAAATYLVYYGNHIAKEEEDVLSRAALSLTSDEWEDMRSAVPSINDPMGHRGDGQRYRELRRQIAMEA